MIVNATLKLLLLLLLTIEVVNAMPSGGVVVSEHVGECDHKGPTLFCDFKNSPQVVWLDRRPSESVEKVFMYNVETLHIMESLCVDVSLHNVKKVTVFTQDTNVSCARETELSAKATKLNRVPHSIRRLYLEDSTIESLSTLTSLSKLTVINSKVNVMNLLNPLAEGTAAVLQGSTVERLKKLIIGSNTHVMFLKTHISAVVSGGLILRPGAKVTVKDSTLIAVQDDSFIIGPEVTIDIYNYSGNMKFITKRYADVLNCKKDGDCVGRGGRNTTKFQFPTETLNNEGDTSTPEERQHYFGGFVAFVILFLLVCIVIVSYYFVKRKRRKENQINQTLHECEEQEPCEEPIETDIEPEKESQPLVSEKIQPNLPSIKLIESMRNDIENILIEIKSDYLTCQELNEQNYKTMIETLNNNLSAEISKLQKQKSHYLNGKGEGNQTQSEYRRQNSRLIDLKCESMKYENLNEINAERITNYATVLLRQRALLDKQMENSQKAIDLWKTTHSCYQEFVFHTLILNSSRDLLGINLQVQLIDMQQKLSEQSQEETDRHREYSRLLCTMYQDKCYSLNEGLQEDCKKIDADPKIKKLNQRMKGFIELQKDMLSLSCGINEKKIKGECVINQEVEHQRRLIVIQDRYFKGINKFILNVLKSLKYLITILKGNGDDEEEWEKLMDNFAFDEHKMEVTRQMEYQERNFSVAVEKKNQEVLQDIS